MLGLEKKIIITAVLFLVTAIALLTYSIFGLGIKLPGCVVLPQAFTKGEVIQKSDNLVEVHVLARMWTFEPAEIKIKPNTILDIYLASLDVNHGFHIENTNVNLMAVPGAINYARVTLKEPGIYHVVCHEYCGAGHQNMAARIIVGDILDQPLLLTEGSHWFNELQAQVMPGKTLFSSKGCIACHSINGDKATGPTFLNLYGRKEKMSTGQTLIVDDAYIAESIKEPAAKIVNGFQPVMPKLPVTDEEIGQIITYLKTLKE